MLRSVATTDFTPCSLKKSWISRRTFGLSLTLLPTQRFRIGSAPSRRITPATILVVSESAALPPIHIGHGFPAEVAYQKGGKDPKTPILPFWGAVY